MSVVWSGVTWEGKEVGVTWEDKEVGVGYLVGCHVGGQGGRCLLSGRVSHWRARR